MSNYGKLQSIPFKWWVGVVENKIDPLELGRYQVRIMGYHTANRETLKTTELPWAIPMHPTTSAAISGVSETPNLMQGSTVVGFFADGDDGQIPVIMGSLAGMPVETNFEEGFSDPGGKYPREGQDGLNEIGESDLPRLARNAKAEEHRSLKNKRAERNIDIRTAKASSFGAFGKYDPEILPDKEVDFEGVTWEEMHPRGAEELGYYDPTGETPPDFSKPTSVYPFNKVKETATGHVFEVDDTPGWGRIAEYHNSGTFTEIFNDEDDKGNKVTKVQGKNHAIYMKGSNVRITGQCNVTIEGDAKLLVTGNKYEEVEGDYYLTVHGDRVTNITKNDVLGVGTDQTVGINGSRAVRVACGDEGEGADTLTVEGRQNISVVKTRMDNVTGSVMESYAGGPEGKMHSTMVGGNGTGKRAEQVFEGKALRVGKDWKVGITGAMELGSAGNMTLHTELDQIVTVKQNKSDTITGNQTIDVDGTQTITAPTVDIVYDTGKMEVSAGAGIIDTGKVLHSHTHAQSADAGGNAQEETDPPS